MHSNLRLLNRKESVKMTFDCLTNHHFMAKRDNCGPVDVGSCRPEGVCNPDVDMCGPDYGVDCMPECDPADDL